LIPTTTKKKRKKEKRENRGREGGKGRRRKTVHRGKTGRGLTRKLIMII
jgi:hypothetical protein